MITTMAVSLAAIWNGLPLRRLMADIQMGKVDIVVVYKIDRLSRSLADFADGGCVRPPPRHSAPSRSRSTRPPRWAVDAQRPAVLRQFEREVTGERIRDKIAASKAKGMWMGGPCRWGTTWRPSAGDQRNGLVRRIFDDFVTVRSATLMAKAYGAEGVVTKGGKPFTKQTIYKMLHNRMYLGEIVHKGRVSRPASGHRHAGAVGCRPRVDRHRWHRSGGARPTTASSEPVLLRGLLFTPDGERLVPSYTVKKGKTYRYYSPIKHRRFGAWASQHGHHRQRPLRLVHPADRGGAVSAAHRAVGVGSDADSPAQTSSEPRWCCRCEIWLACGNSCFPPNSVDWRSC